MSAAIPRGRLMRRVDPLVWRALSVGCGRGKPGGTPVIHLALFLSVCAHSHEASIRLASTVCDAAGQHTREGWDAKKAEQAPSTLPLPQRSNPETVFHGKVIVS